MPTRRAFAYTCSAAIAVLAAPPAFADWDRSKLEAGIRTIEQGTKGRLGVGLLDLKDRSRWSYRGAEPFPLQSVFKLPLAIGVLQAVEAGKLQLDQAITVTRNDLSLYHSPLARAFKGARNDYTLRDLLTRSTIASDNTAADLLLRLIGGPQALTALLKEGGVAGISVDRYERVFQPEILGLPGYGWDRAIDTAQFYAAIQAIPAAERRRRLAATLTDRRDAATPDASIAFLEGLARGTWLREPAHNALVERLAAESKTGPNRIRAGLPAGARFAHKTGLGPSADGLNHATNDIGIVTLPDGRRFAIAVYLAGARVGETEREAAHAAAARLAVESLR
ncbi:class A beta-lactamase [Bosea sp. CS1GBMeth4]|uniref:class A beta-lactamase n=1 Tax=Bosea sp. CS1GBMeth4 TaxID=1892849 RepID=UPI001644FB66|nr:class A beta-lactamase [Bosea sp. CS1GBMeth4]